MGVAAHLGINLREYDARIRTFIPRYEEMLDRAGATLALMARRAPRIVDLGTGTGALAARCLDAMPSARIVGIDSDPDMLRVARRRLGRRLETITGDFARTALPSCDAVTASFSLHHVRTRRQKRTVYRRCAEALRAGGVLISADCYLSSDRRVQAQDRAVWRAHLEQVYSRREADAFLRAWAREDVYFPLADEIEMLESVGFTVDVIWRHDGFAVIAAVKRSAPRRNL